MLTRKFPDMRDCDQAKPSVHRLMPLSSTLKMKTAPLLTMVRRSKSLSLRVTLGIIPRRAACRVYVSPYDHAKRETVSPPRRRQSHCERLAKTRAMHTSMRRSASMVVSTKPSNNGVSVDIAMMFGGVEMLVGRVGGKCGELESHRSGARSL